MPQHCETCSDRPDAADTALYSDLPPDACVFNIANPMLLVFLRELFKVKHSKIKENNGLNPSLEFSLGQKPVLQSGFGITNVGD